METLTIQLQGLRETDEQVLKVFLRFMGAQDGVHWQLVHEAPAHLLLHPADQQPQPGGDSHPVCVAIGRREQSPGLDDSGMLTRPLQFDAFNALLQSVRTHWHQRLQTMSGPQAAAPAVPAVQPTAAPSSAAAPTLVPPAAVYRLRRWPTRELLLSHPQWSRLAACLVNQPRQAVQLAKLARVGAADCESFLDHMLALELIERLQPGSGPAERPVAATPPARAAVQPAAPSGSALLATASLAAAPSRASAPRSTPAGGAAAPSFIGRLRRHLGLH